MTCTACGSSLTPVVVHGFGCNGAPCGCTLVDHVCKPCMVTRAPQVRSGHNRIWRHFDLWQERKRVEAL